MSDSREEIRRLHGGFGRWRDLDFAGRAAALCDIADGIEARGGELSRLMAREMGKPVSQGLAEAEKCARVCRYYAEHGGVMLADESLDGGKAVHEPLGVILAIMPWNFPLWQVFRFAAPALMAGNTVLLKHASLVPGCARAIGEIIAGASGRDDLLLPVFVRGEETEELAADPRVRAVTFTGSTETGRRIAATAGRHLKKSVLELGGSDPYLVLKDADIGSAARICAEARMVNGGQSCIAAKRFVVHEAVHNEFVARLAEELSAYVPGDPLDPQTKLGPMAEVRLRDELHEQVVESAEAGAEVLLGGKLLDGSYYPATLLTGVRPGMRVFDEETFGPVAAVVKAESEDEGLRLANLSVFGLGAAVFSRDEDRALRLARQLEAGTVAINAQVVSDPRLPFGGIKDSGWGRELGVHGIREFVNVKTIRGV